MSLRIPVALRQYTQNTSDLQMEATTLAELIQQLNARFPGLMPLIVNEAGELRRYVNIFVNDQDARSEDGLMTKLKEGDRVSIVPVVAGG